jgi:hypothetical protein
VLYAFVFQSQEGLINTAWGSHVYYTSVAVFDQTARPADFPRPMTLTKFAPPDWVVRRHILCALHSSILSLHLSITFTLLLSIFLCQSLLLFIFLLSISFSFSLGIFLIKTCR